MILSRLTIASAEDLGYAVDYDSAESYGSDQLGKCNCRRRLHTEVLEFPGTRPVRRKLRQDLREAAIAAGRAYLNEQKLQGEEIASPNKLVRTSSDGLVKFVGGDVVTVMVRQDDVLFDVVVSSTRK